MTREGLFGGCTATEKPVGEGKKELAVPLAVCSSVGGGALTSIWRGCRSVASSPYQQWYSQKARAGWMITAVFPCRL